MADKTIGRNLKAVREFYGYTKIFVARQIGISTKGYRDIESGISSPHIGTLKRITDFYGISLGDVTDDKSNLQNLAAKRDVIKQLELEIVTIRTLLDRTKTRLQLTKDLWEKCRKVGSFVMKESKKRTSSLQRFRRTNKSVHW